MDETLGDVSAAMTSQVFNVVYKMADRKSEDAKI